MNILAIFNAKGGVAKTTTAVNLAAGMAALGARVLLVDLDYQGNATTSLGLADLPRRGAYDLITGRQPLHAVVRETFIPGLSLVGATANLAAVDVELALKDARHDVLRRLLADPSISVDVVVLDCPPAVGVLTLNALVSATAVLVPTAPEPYAHDGLMRTWALLTRIRGEMNTDMKILGILPTLVRPDHLEEDTGQVLAAMKAVFGSRVPPEGIPRDDRLFADSAAHGVPALILDPDAAASAGYLRLARQVCARPDGPDGGVVLRRLDDPADVSAGLAEALARLRRIRAREHDLLAHPRNTVPVDPEAEIAPQPDDPEPVRGPGNLRLALGGASLALLAGLLGFAAGWAAAGGGP